MALKSDPEKIHPLQISNYPSEHGKALCHDAYKARLMQEAIDDLASTFDSLASTAKALVELCDYYKEKVERIKEDI